MAHKVLPVSFDERKIDAIFAEVDQTQLPGVAVGMAINGTPVYRKGFGLANMELPIVLSPSMRMRIASMTKHFTCLAYMLLCEEGKAGIDDPIGKYLPELHPVSRAVPVRQLMGHVSGLRDVHDIRYQFSGFEKMVSADELLAPYRHIDSVNFAPGTSWSYNNGGYLMLSFAIERISNRPLDDFWRDRVFDPAGMHDTLLRRYNTDFLSNCATSHMTKQSGGFEKLYIAKEHVGEGGIVSTVDDMLRWLAHMEAPLVGSADTWRLMKEPMTLANGTSTGYGLGLGVGRYRGVETISHSGGLMGSNSHMVKVPAAGLDAVIMVNRHDVLGTQLIKKMLDACIPGLDPMEQSTGDQLVSGVFCSPASSRLVQLYAKQGQQFASIDGMELPVRAEPGGVLRPAPEVSTYKLGITLEGDRSNPASIRLSDFGNIDHLTVVEPAKSADVAAIMGTYRSRGVECEVTIVESEGGPQMQASGTFGSITHRLEPIAEGIWQAKSNTVLPLGGMLVFDRDARSFRFSTGRTSALVFRRD